MIRYFLLIFYLYIGTLTVSGQTNDVKIDLNNFLKLTVDSIEMSVSGKGKNIDTFYYLNYSMINISDDTLTIVTNSCPSGNQYLLKINDSTFQVNKGVHCFCNVFKTHIIAPNGSFSSAEMMFANFVNLKSEMTEICLEIPLVYYGSSEFRVQKKMLHNNKEDLELKYEGNTKIIFKKVKYSKSKKNH